MTILGELAQTNFAMYEGDDFVIQATMKDLDGVAVDVTSAGIKWALFSSPSDSGAALVSKETGSGIDIIDGPNGRYNINIASSDTEGFEPGQYYHEAQAVIGGKSKTVMVGFVAVRKSKVS